MIVEILCDGENVLVRRFGAGLAGRWTVVTPGQTDRAVTGLSYEELKRIGPGVWELRAKAG